MTSRRRRCILEVKELCFILKIMDQQNYRQRYRDSPLTGCAVGIQLLNRSQIEAES